MKKKNVMRVLLAASLCGGTVTAVSCGELIRQSVRDGLYDWLAGQVGSSISVTAIGDQITDTLIDTIVDQDEAGTLL